MRTDSLPSEPPGKPKNLGSLRVWSYRIGPLPAEFGRVSSAEFGYLRLHSGMFGSFRACSAVSGRTRFSSKSGWRSSHVRHIRFSPAPFGCSAVSDRSRSVSSWALAEVPTPRASEFPPHDVTRRGGASLRFPGLGAGGVSGGDSWGRGTGGGYPKPAIRGGGPGMATTYPSLPSPQRFWKRHNCG